MGLLEDAGGCFSGCLQWIGALVIIGIICIFCGISSGETDTILWGLGLFAGGVIGSILLIAIIKAIIEFIKDLFQ